MMKLVDVPGGTGGVRNPKRNSPAVVPRQERETIPLQRSAQLSMLCDSATWKILNPGGLAR